MVRVTGLEPARLSAQDPKSCTSANSAIPAYTIENYLAAYMIHQCDDRHIFFRPNQLKQTKDKEKKRQDHFAVWTINQKIYKAKNKGDTQKG